MHRADFPAWLHALSIVSLPVVWPLTCLFRPDYGAVAEVSTPEFWMAMQLAMLKGFCTAYPTNWWLIRAGFKEKL